MNRTDIIRRALKASKKWMTIEDLCDYAKMHGDPNACSRGMSSLCASMVARGEVECNGKPRGQRASYRWIDGAHLEFGRTFVGWGWRPNHGPAGALKKSIAQEAFDAALKNPDANPVLKK